MINVYITAANIEKGFPQAPALHLIRVRKTGTLEDCINNAIDQFDKFALGRAESSYFLIYRAAIIEAMATLDRGNRVAHFADGHKISVTVSMLMDEEIKH